MTLKGERLKSFFKKHFLKLAGKTILKGERSINAEGIYFKKMSRQNDNNKDYLSKDKKIFRK